MFRQSFVPVFNRVFLNAIIAAMKATPIEPLSPGAVSIRLLTGSPSITPDTALATFTALEADFSGYAAVTQADPDDLWSVALSNGGIGIQTTASGLFVATAPFTVANTVTGYYVSMDTNTDWVLAELFAEEVPIAQAGDFLSLDLSAGFRFLGL